MSFILSICTVRLKLNSWSFTSYSHNACFNIVQQQKSTVRKKHSFQPYNQSSDHVGRLSIMLNIDTLTLDQTINKMKPCDITTLFNFYISKRIKVNSASVNQQSFPFPSRAKERWRLLIRRMEWLRNYMLYIKFLFSF